jgi:hypothetical protein
LVLATATIGLLWSFIRDPQYWEDLLRFRPLNKETDKALAEIDSFERTTLRLRNFLSTLDEELAAINRACPDLVARASASGELGASWNKDIYNSIMSKGLWSYKRSYSPSDTKDPPASLLRLTEGENGVAVSVRHVPNRELSYQVITTQEEEPSSSGGKAVRRILDKTEVFIMLKSEYIHLGTYCLVGGKGKAAFPDLKQPTAGEGDTRVAGTVRDDHAPETLDGQIGDYLKQSVRNLLALMDEARQELNANQSSKKMVVTQLASSEGVFWSMAVQRLFVSVVLVAIVHFFLRSVGQDLRLSRRLVCLEAANKQSGANARPQDVYKMFNSLSNGFASKGRENLADEGILDVSTIADRVATTVKELLRGPTNGKVDVEGGSSPRATADRKPGAARGNHGAAK